jgi:hypothetical protein
MASSSEAIPMGGTVVPIAMGGTMGVGDFLISGVVGTFGALNDYIFQQIEGADSFDDESTARSTIYSSVKSKPVRSASRKNRRRSENEVEENREDDRHDMDSGFEEQREPASCSGRTASTDAPEQHDASPEDGGFLRNSWSQSGSGSLQSPTETRKRDNKSATKPARERHEEPEAPTPSRRERSTEEEKSQSSSAFRPQDMGEVTNIDWSESWQPAMKEKDEIKAECQPTSPAKQVRGRSEGRHSPELGNARRSQSRGSTESRSEARSNSNPRTLNGNEAKLAEKPAEKPAEKTTENEVQVSAGGNQNDNIIPQECKQIDKKASVPKEHEQNGKKLIPTSKITPNERKKNGKKVTKASTLQNKRVKKQNMHGQEKASSDNGEVKPHASRDMKNVVSKGITRTKKATKTKEEAKQAKKTKEVRLRKASKQTKDGRSPKAPAAKPAITSKDRTFQGTTPSVKETTITNDGTSQKMTPPSAEAVTNKDWTTQNSPSVTAASIAEDGTSQKTPSVKATSATVNKKKKKPSMFGGLFKTRARVQTTKKLSKKDAFVPEIDEEIAVMAVNNNGVHDKNLNVFFSMSSIVGSFETEDVGPPRVQYEEEWMDIMNQPSEETMPSPVVDRYKERDSYFL